MLASNLFYSELALKSITPYLRSNGLSSSKNNNQFPLLFTKCKPRTDTKFYEKYMMRSLYTKHLKNLLNVLSQSEINEQTQDCQRIQPNLLRKIKQKQSVKKSHLQINKLEIKSASLICKNIFQGIFMHRSLNMPSECYSVQQIKQENIIMRMRRKMTRQQHITLLEHKQELYNQDGYRLQKFYMDGYSKFIETEKVTRLLVEINAEIEGKLITDKKQSITLPLDNQKPITTHLLQIEEISVPGRSEIENSLLTDVDYFMQGNPYTN